MHLQDFIEPIKFSIRSSFVLEFDVAYIYTYIQGYITYFNPEDTHIKPDLLKPILPSPPMDQALFRSCEQYHKHLQDLVQLTLVEPIEFSIHCSFALEFDVAHIHIYIQVYITYLTLRTRTCTLNPTHRRTHSSLPIYGSSISPILRETSQVPARPR